MASPAFRSKATAGEATAANVTCNVPAGVADDDILLFLLSKDATGAVTWPSGWNILAEDTADTFYTGVGWRRAATEPANYTWTFASTWRSCVMLAYSGAINSENPLDPDTPSAMTTGTSVTSLATNNDVTTTASTTAVAFHTAKNLTAWAAEPGGWTARQNTGGGVEVHVMDQAVATASTVTGPTQSVTGPAGPMKSYLLALQSVAASGGGVTVKQLSALGVG